MKTIYFSIIFCCLFNVNKLNASHIIGADITYRIIDTSANNRRYLITLTRYRYCGGINYGNNNLKLILPGSSPDNLSIPTIASGLPKEVTPLCDIPDVVAKTQTHCPGPNVPEINGIKGVMREVRTAEITVGKRGWIFVGYNEGGRNPITTASGGTNFWIQCGINTDYINNSLVFASDPVMNWCKGRVNCYSHAPLDTFDEIMFGSKYEIIDGKRVLRDSISFERYIPWEEDAFNLLDLIEGKNQPITLASGINAEQFLFVKPGTGGVRMDSITGEICTWPADMDQDAIMAVMVWEWRAEPKAGGGYQRTRISYVCRDLQFSVRSNCPGTSKEGVLVDSTLNVNTFTLDKNYIEICGSRSGFFTFKGVGPVAQNMHMKQISPTPSEIFGAKFTVTKVKGNNVDTVYSKFEFDSTKGSGMTTIYFDFYYCNSNGIKVSESYPIKIVYINDVWFEKDTLTYCTGGDPVRLTPKGAKKFSWTPNTGIVAAGPDSSWIDVAPNTGIQYTAKGLDLNLIKSCNETAHIYVKSIQPFTYSIQPSKNIEACLGDSIPIFVQPDNSQTPYIYNWNGSTSNQLFNRSNQTKGNTINNPYLWANATGPLYLKMESKFGCILRDTIQFHLRGARHSVDALSNKSFVCNGDTVNLSATITPSKTGPSIYKSSSDNRIVNMAQATSAEYPASNCSGTGCYPNIFGVSGLGASSTTRVLYRASDLNLQGAKAGIIKSLSINITNLSIPSFDGFEIKMGSTNSNILNNSINVALHTVYNEKAITCVSGLNTYILDRAFDWDGKSNIVIEFCIKRDKSSSNMNRYRATDGVANNLIIYKNSNTVGQLSCQSSESFISPPGITASRPWVRFAMTGIDSSDNQFTSTWTPNSIIKSVLVSTRAVGAPSYEDTVFRIQYGSNICFGNDTVVVKVDTNFRVRATASKNVVCRPAGGSAIPVNLNASVSSNQSYTLSWRSNDPSFGTPSVANPIANPSTNGTFMYIARIENAPCFSEDTTYVTFEDSLKFTLKRIQPSCNLNNGILSIEYPKGTDSNSFFVLWNPLGNTNHIINNLSTGSYSAFLTLKSDQTCNGTQSLNLTQNLNPLKIEFKTSPVRCNGEKSDSIVASASYLYAPGPYSYSWSTLETSPKIIDKSPGKYIVTATDVITGCQGIDSFILIEPDILNATFTKKDITCYNTPSGSIKIIPSGGTTLQGNYSFTWTSINGLNSNRFKSQNNEQDSLFADSINCIITDLNGCSINVNTSILQPDSALKTSINTIIDSINTSSNILILLTSGGTKPYNAKLFIKASNGQWQGTPTQVKNPLMNLDSFKGLSPNIYKIDILDSNQCVNTDSIFIDNVGCDTSLVSLSFTFNNDLLEVQTAGQFVNPLTYLWSNSQNNKKINIVDSGTYCVTVTDFKGCVKKACTTINIVPNNPFPCNLKANFDWKIINGSYSFKDSSSAPGYGLTYSWNFGDGASSSKRNPIKNYNSNGTYLVRLIVNSWSNSQNLVCSDTIIKTIIVNDTNVCNLLNVDFQWNQNGNVYSFINTTNTSGYNIINTRWLFSDGTTINFSNPTRSLTIPGTYSVTLSLSLKNNQTNLICNKQITKNIIITASPTLCNNLSANFNYNKNNNVLNIINASTGTNANTKYQYVFDNGDTANTANVSYTFSTPGMKKITLIVKHTFGSHTCIDSTTRYVAIYTSNNCKDSGYTDNYSNCGTYTNYVCGCDSITYINACEAHKIGVKSYRMGVCTNDPNLVKLCGFVVLDSNKNCQKDQNEKGLKNVNIKITGNNKINYTQTDSIGFYEIWLPKGLYNIEQILSNYNYIISNGIKLNCPSLPIVINANIGAQTYCGLNFYDTIFGCNDLKVVFHRITTTTPGFFQLNTIVYENNSAAVINNVVLKYKMTNNTLLNFASTGYNTNSNIISWNLGTLAPLSSGSKTLLSYVPVNYGLGVVTTDSAWIEPISGDCNFSDNVSKITDTSVGSYDPNDKNVVPSGNIDTATKTLDFLIRFQNTGTAPAHNVRIDDVIDNKIDLESIVMTGLSHNGRMIKQENRMLVFEFPNIMLPDSGTDFEGSNGYVSFRANLVNNATVGDEIKNTAAIFFDFNDPIITNTTHNKIVLESNSRINNKEKGYEVRIYPNPIREQLATFEIALEKSASIVLNLYDLQGRLLWNFEKVNTGKYFMMKLPWNDLKKGIYLLELKINQNTSDIFRIEK